MSNHNIILDRKHGLYLKNTKTKGRGLFCVTAIKKGETLEVSPAVILNEAATDHVDETILANYTFETGKIPKRLRERAQIRRTGHASAVIMGIASFCNHSENPNAEILWEERKGTLYYTLQAIRPIAKNTEICTTYGDGWFDDRL